MNLDINLLRQAIGLDQTPATQNIPRFGAVSGELQKALTPASGVVGYNLEDQVKLMMPIYTVLRRRTPVDVPERGALQATWKMFLSHGINFGKFGVASGDIGQEQSSTAVQIQAPYASASINDTVQIEAIDMARNFDDAMQVSTIRALVALLRLEELMLLGGNYAALPAPASISSSITSSGGSLGTGNYQVRVTALSYEGWLSGSVGTAAGAPAYGESVPASAVVTISSGTTNQITLSWPAVQGAVAYNVFIDNGAAGTIRFVAQTTINKYTVTAYPASGGQPPATDTTANSNVWEGYLAWCAKSTIYGQSIPNKVFVDAAGNGLTTTPGGIAELDSVLEQIWIKWNTSPTLIIGSPKFASKITQIILGGQNALNYWVDISQERGAMTGGIFIGGYTNKYVMDLQGMPKVIPIIAHPYWPDGTLLFISMRVPYPFAREARGFALDVLRPYSYFPLAPVARAFPYALFFTQTLKCYHPGPQAVLTGVNLTV